MEHCVRYKGFGQRRIDNKSIEKIDYIQHILFILWIIRQSQQHQNKTNALLIHVINLTDMQMQVISIKNYVNFQILFNIDLTESNHYMDVHCSWKIEIDAHNFHIFLRLIQRLSLAKVGGTPTKRNIHQYPLITIF